ncbi:MAG: TAT-variant-translocated molybdopterin oxidoreductase [Phycisphaerales bacterium]|nr:TAT-variant-translocated molybdopterin oxidoreductase [Phycisphaerales bacterium]
MSTLDQCPSTKGKAEIPTDAPAPGTVSGRSYWRSLEEYSGSPEFKEFVEREFPVDASLMSDSSRRNFLKVMGASAALAGAATMPGCRRPDRKIMPYSKEVPEQVIPGRPLFFASAIELPGGGAEGLLIETHTGRPTKVEGNPNHPINRGKSSAFAQASVLGLYDPDRLKYPVYNNPTRGRLDATWDDFKSWQGEHFAKFDATQGQGLVFVIEKKTSPTRDRMRDLIKKRWPRAQWTAWSPAESFGMVNGTKLATGGKAQWVSYNFAGAKTVVSIGGDFMSEGPNALRHARDFAATRRVTHAGDEMSRLYVAESKPSEAGSMADHRFRVAPSQMHKLIVSLAHAVFSELHLSTGGLNAVDVPGVSAHDIEAMAKDLVAHKGHAVVVPGQSLFGADYALCLAINDALGAMGSMVEMHAMDEDIAVYSHAAMSDLVYKLQHGQVDTLVCVGVNPVYDGPVDGLSNSGSFADAFSKAKTTITLDVGATETAAASTWSLNGTHNMEAWGDVRATDGTLSIVQPMIAPLFEPAMSEIEFLSLLAGDPKDGYTLVQETNSSVTGKAWNRALHDGVVAGSAGKAASPGIRTAGILEAAARVEMKSAPTENGLDVMFYTTRYNDGRGANNGWLQELPEFGSSVVWDNPLLMSPGTAKTLGVLPEHTGIDEFNPYTKQQMPQARLVTITVDGHEMTAAAWILPGMADNTVAVKLGYGREVVGKVGFDVGHNTYKIKPLGEMTARAAKIKRAGGTYTIASTQNHWSLSVQSEASREDSRHSIVRAMDKKYWDMYGDEVVEVHDEVYGVTSSKLNAAERLGELSHTPPNISIYKNPQNESHRDAASGSDFAKNPQWGMTIDMSSCSGCGVCTVACQSENNIPVVGKSEVAKGREMQWIRVDRYFVGEHIDNPDEIYAQPIACVHCENAPCETVCPVNATTHGSEGTNDMAYNRCIGTRYCANNCPYKVRRFNFFDYGPAKFNGGLNATYVSKGLEEKFEETIGQDRTFNQNFIPPRLRKKLDEISKMQFNPDVTVRSRGVMEKCTYCIQRVNHARQDVKINGIWKDKDQVGPIPDGYFQVACQQACPTDSIVFGDILDPASKVSGLREGGRGYKLLGYLNTRPRTSHLMRVRNPNPAIREYDLHDPFSHGGGHGDEHGGGHDDGHGAENGHTDEHGASEQHSSAYIDRMKKIVDDGYSLSLRVMSGINA